MYNVISGDQVRMARSLLRWSVNDLAKASGVGISTVRRIEDAVGIPKARLENLQAVHDVLVATGKLRFESSCVISLHNIGQ